MEGKHYAHYLCRDNYKSLQTMKRQKERPKRKETKEEEKEEESRNKSLSKRIRKKIGRKQKQSGVIITAIDTGERGE